MNASMDLWTGLVWPLVIMVAQSLAVIVPVLVSLAFILYADRKIWAAVHLRRGPNVVGPFGLLQSFADFAKFLFKETVIPAGANKFIFFLAPMISFVTAVGAWAVVPFNPHWVVADINVGILYLFAVSSMGVYGIIMAGWASNSKYPFLGGLRSAAQMVSYEVSIGFVLIAVLLCVGSLRISDIVTAQERLGLWFIIPHFPMFVIFFVSALAETNRPPFDLPEAESELVAGHMVEYSSTAYLLFMVAEYFAIVLMCVMIAILFLGGWLPPLNIAPFTWIPGPLWLIGKALAIFFLFAMVKVMVPRYRYDQLMRLGWKVFLPFSLAWVVLTASVLVGFGLLPK